MLTGRVAHRDGQRAIFDVHGVGYEVFSPSRVLDGWAGEEQVVAWVATRVREDAITLYGFADDTERQAFDVLTGVTGVGPKMALAALEAMAVGELVRAVEGDDMVALCKIAGVGKKKAQRLALELKGKLPASFVPVAGTARRTTPDDPLPLALAQLDYGKSEIDRAQMALDEQGLGADQPLQARLQAALRYLSGT
mgnify:FL=1